MSLEVVQMPLASLKEYDGNAKIHDDANVEAIRASIRRFGMCDPIGVWTTPNGDVEIVEGHGRKMALEAEGYEVADVIFLDHLTDEERRAYALAHNQTTLMSDFDLDILEAELDLLADFGMDDFGFDMLGASDRQERPDDDIEIIEDVAPSTAEQRCKPGDIWQLGRHRLMCGDSTDSHAVSTLMNGERASAMFTDPPYGMSFQSNMRQKSERFDILKNDDIFVDFIPAVKPFVDGFVFVCTTWKVLGKWLELFEEHYRLTNLIVWDKGGGGIGDLKHTFSTDYEIILCSNNDKELTGKRIGSVWDCGKDSPADYEHPTQKPVALPATAILHTTNAGDVVLDVFGGSGSTLLACEQTDRTCYTMELDPHYCDVIISRWERFTGETAVKCA